MGFGGIGPGSLLLILLIVFLLFGTKKLKNLGGDLGGAIKGFKKAMDDDQPEKVEDKSKENNTEKVIEGEAEKVDKTESK